DGTRREVLPRGYLNGQLLKDVDAVLGVNDGFVVCGRFGASVQAWKAGQLQIVAFHYDFHHRRVRGYLIPAKNSDNPRWFSFPDLHCIGCRAGNEEWTFDLATGGRAPDPDHTGERTARARQALTRLGRRAVPAPRLAKAGE